MTQSLLGDLLLADVVAINTGFSLVLGSLASTHWLRDAASPWSDAAGVRGAVARRVGLVVTLLGLICAVWFQAALMGDAPLLKAGPTAQVLLRDTHFGHVALAGLVAWCVVATACWNALSLGRSRFWLVGFGLAAFVWSRSAVAHAGSQGDLSVDVCIDAVHLLAACLWVGMVLVAVTFRLPQSSLPRQDRLDATQWVNSLSSTATAALAVIVITGTLKLWRSGYNLTALVASDYGLALGSKVALVTIAAALGGFNRFRVLPRLFDSLRADAGSEVAGSWNHRLRFALRAEALVLFTVLIAAAVLAATEPPSE
jgi:putative copper resistance protein D